MKIKDFFEKIKDDFLANSRIFGSWFKKKWTRYQGWRWLTIVFLSIFFLISSYGVFLAKKTNVRGLKSALQTSTEIYDYKGQKAGALYSQKGTWVPLDKISDNVQNAVLSTEDRNFYHEYGFSITGIGRAALLYAKNKILHRDYISGGGSTLTQQLVKNAFLSQEQTFSRKIKEIFIAMQVENDYSKKDILAMYLNNAYFGNGVWGVEDAAEKYFGVHASELSVPQAATLAGMLKSPTAYNPIDHPQASRDRRNVVLGLMEDNKKLSAEQVSQYQATPMTTNDSYQYTSSYRYPYYFDAVINEAMNRYGLSETDIMNRGYKIYTSLNQNYQIEMQDDFADSSLFPYNAEDGTKAQGASIAINPQNGGVAAVVGGREGTHVFRGYNRGTQLVRSPGSTIKPLAVYTPALQSGYHYDTDVKDELKAYGKDKYEPHNWNDVYSGEIPMYQALAESKNTSAVWLLNKIGVSKGYKSVEKFGIKLTSDDENLSLALGGLKKGVSPYQMANAYTAFANGGKLYTAHFITKIVDAQGKVIVDNTENDSKKIMTKKIANEMTSMMMDVYRTGGTGQSASPSGYTIAGKTGSTESLTASNSSNENDHWYIGYTPDVVVATWVGFDSTKYSLSEEGIRGGASLFKNEMEGILPHTAGNTFTVKPASTMVAQESGASSSSSNVWDTFRKAGETLDDSFSKSASDWGSKASSLFDQGKQKLQEWFGQ